jgi:hypothetical protein
MGPNSRSACDSSLQNYRGETDFGNGGFWYDAGVTRVEALWIRILGVLLIVLGLTLLVSPRITYTRGEQIPHTRFTVKREKTIFVPRPAAVLIIGTGAIALIAAGKSGSRSQ